MVRAFILSLFVLAAAGLPSEAAKRTVQLFTVPYAFDFSRDFKFIKREEQADGKRDTVYFSDRNRSIAISASVYDPANVGTLLSREAYVAKMEADNLSDIKYVNDETPDGRLGSHLLGACDPKHCFYKMQSVVGQKIWLSVVVACDDCSKTDVKEVGVLAENLYKRLRSF
jgi:hypothetical protein